MIMSASMPRIVKKFIDLFWANLPRKWAIKQVYHKGALFIIILIPINGREKKIKRQYKIETIKARSEDLWGLASDCADQVKNSINKQKHNDN